MNGEYRDLAWHREFSQTFIKKFYNFRHKSPLRLTYKRHGETPIEAIKRYAENRGVKIPGYLSEEYRPLIWASDLFYRELVIISDMVYKVEAKDHDDSDIFESSKNLDGSINFQVKFYNGGCSFYEAIDSAIENMENK